MPRDEFFGKKDDLVAPFTDGQAVTPSDSVDLNHVSRGIYVGVGGDLSVVMESGVTLTFVGLASGTLLPARATRVRSTLTTATSIVAVW